MATAPEHHFNGEQKTTGVLRRHARPDAPATDTYEASNTSRLMLGPHPIKYTNFGSFTERIRR
jgi:hypothetical protein